MTNEITTFNFDDQDVRIIVDENSNPWFCAKDVCKALGYSKPSNAVSQHCVSKGTLKQGTPTSSGIQELTYIDERNLYRLVMRSKLESAERFQDWVCGEVLPTIRKTGAYSRQQPIAIPQTLPEALRLAADLAEKNQKLLEEQKINAPKVEFTDRVVADNNAMTITKAAKLIGYPPRKFKDYIRSIGWLYANADTPMESAIKAGYMVLRFAHWTDSEGNPVEKPYAHITTKGIFALYKRMRQEGLIEKNSQLELAA